MKSGFSLNSVKTGGPSQDLLARRLRNISRLAAYVGIPASSSAQRSEQLLSMAEKIVSKADAAGKKASKRQAKKYSRLVDAAQQDVSNAQLLRIFSNGSLLRNQPPRPVLEPAVENSSGLISKEIAEASRMQLKGDASGAEQHMKRAAMIAQNAARARFTDPSNGWAPNAPSTIAQKGSDRPGIDTASMRNAIVGFVSKS